MTPQQILDLKQKIRELDAEMKDCPDCPNVGFYIADDGCGFPDLRQCEFCYREPNSRFNRFTFYQEALPTLLAYCEELEGKVKVAEELHKAASNADWVQVVLNGGPPCFHIENGRFCLRAERWAGHDCCHKFTTLSDALATLNPSNP